MQEEGEKRLGGEEEEVPEEEVNATPGCRSELVRLTRALTLALIALVTSTAWLASPAHADRVYWANSSLTTISFANLDGSGIADVNTGAATVQNPEGVAIDPAGGRLYWASANPTPGAGKISFANLDGSGGANLDTTPATVSDPFGVAINPAAGRIYWANFNTPAGISATNTNGSGGGANLSTIPLVPSGPIGVTVDPAAGRIYWADASANKISYANLDGTGGGHDLSPGIATVNDPRGVAIDPAAGRIYWANHGTAKISYANLDGSGGGDLPTGAATVSAATGVAIDQAAGRIYWADSSPAPNGKISFANLNGSGGADLITGLTGRPDFPALLKAPAGAEAPSVAGGTAPGSALSCSQGTWATDLLGSFLYRAPQSFAYQWTLNGADIAGAGAAAYTAFTAGAYACRVTASNQAGATSQTSAPHVIATAAAPAPVVITKCKKKHKKHAKHQAAAAKKAKKCHKRKKRR